LNLRISDGDTSHAGAAPSGFAAAGFEAVTDAFAGVLAADGGAASAFAAYLDGETVVDLWGGLADRRTGLPADRDTLYMVFSGTKPLVAVCLLMLVERGVLELDAPVARYWPEFAAADKGGISVAEVVSHRAGLPGLAVSIEPGEILDHVRMARLLAAQPRDPDPRATETYHAYTFGWLCGEIVRRIDGRTVGRFFAEEVAEPLGLDLWIGVPNSKQPRVSRLELAPGFGADVRFDESIVTGDPLMRRVWWNPQLFNQRELLWNTTEFRAAEIPAGNAIGTARSMARLFGCLAAGGSLDGVRILEPATVELGTRCLSRRRDPLTDDPIAVGVGFWLQTELAPFGPVQHGFGHGGAGGSMHGAWPMQRTGFSFCTSLLRDDEDLDGRSARLLGSLAEAVGAISDDPASRLADRI
jgi:CubicO group peptidase (beta-lactamase class C family)